MTPRAGWPAGPRPLQHHGQWSLPALPAEGVPGVERHSGGVGALVWETMVPAPPAFETG